MIAAIYARKSNEQEKTAAGLTESCERQLEHAQQFIGQKDWARVLGGPVSALAFYDDEVSGVTYARLLNRKRMVEAAEALAAYASVIERARKRSCVPCGRRGPA